MVPVSKARSSTTERSRRKFGGNRSSVLNFCYDSRPQSMKAVTHSEVILRGDEDSRSCESAHGADESAFEALSEIESQDRLSIREDEIKASLTVQPDFSAYNFWTSKSDSAMQHGLDLSDTFSRCETAVTPDHASSSVANIDGWGPHIFLDKPTDLLCQSARSGALDDHVELTERENCFWNLPLAIEEDIFEATTDWNTLTAGIQERQEGNETIDEYLVDNPHGSGPVCAVNSDKVDNNLLVYAPNRYIEEAPCIFHSALGKPTQHCDVEGMSLSRIQLEDRIRRRARGQRASQDRRSIFKRRSVRTFDPPAFTLNTEVPADVDADEVREPFENAGHLNFVHNRRRRLRAITPRTKSCELVAPEKPIVSERSPGPVARIRKTDSVRRMMNPIPSSYSPLQSSLSFQKTSTTNHQFVLSGKKEQTVCIPTESSDDPPEIESHKHLRDNGVVRIVNFSTNLSFRNRKRAEAEVGDTPVCARKLICHRSQSSTPEELISKFTAPRYSPVISQFKTSPKDGPVVSTFKRSPRDCLTIRKFWRDSPPSTPPKTLNFLGTFKCIKRSGGPSQQSAAEPHAGGERKSSTKRLRRTPLPKHSVQVLQEWLSENKQMPYPSRAEKDELQLRTELQMSQIENWLGNARQKLRLLKSRSKSVKGFIDSESSPEHPTRRARRKRSS